MAVFVDPRTGDKYDVPDGQADQARGKWGLVAQDQYDLQQEHGGTLEQLKTIPETAAAVPGTLAQGIEDLTGFGTAPGLVNETGTSTAVETAPGFASTPDALARRGANPTAAGIGAAIPAVLAGAVAAPLAPAGVLGTLATEAVVGGIGGEAAQATAEQRPMSVGGVLKNGGIGVVLGGLGLGAGALLRKAVAPGVGPLEETAQRAARAQVPRAIANGAEDLADPEVAARVSEHVAEKTAQTVDRLDSALADVRPPIANNLQAQRDALAAVGEALRDEHPEVATEIDRLRGLSRQGRFQGLQGLLSEDLPTTAAQQVEQLANDTALWGDKAVTQASAVRAARAAKDSSPEAFADAVRSIDDPRVKSLVADLDDHLATSSSVDAAQAFGRQESTVGAAKSTFADSDYETSIKELRNHNASEPLPNIKKVSPAKLAEEAPGLRSLAAHNAADNFDTVDQVLRKDINYAAKAEDFGKGAKAWTPELIAKQDTWVAERAADGAQAIEKVKALQQGGYDLRGLGAEAKKTLENGLQRVGATEGAERNLALDALKRNVDQLTKRVNNSRQLDSGSQRALTAVLEPYANELRKGLGRETLFGANGPLQASMNAAWNDLIDPYARVQKQFSDLLGREWAESGASANIRRYDPQDLERVFAHPEGGGRGLHQDLSAALDGLDAMVAARKTHGLTRLGRLDDMRTALAAIKDDFDFAAVLRQAEKEAGSGHGHFAGMNPGGAAAAVGMHIADAPGMPLFGYGRALRGPVIQAGNAGFRRAAGVLERAGLISSELAPAETATGRVLGKHIQRLSRTQQELLGDTSYTSQILGERTRKALGKAGASVAGVGGIYALAHEGEAKAAELNQADSDADTVATARALTDPEYADRYAKRLTDVPSTLEGFQGPHETLQQAFAERRAAVEGFSRDPDALIDAMSNAFGGLPDELRGAVAAKAFQVAQYLKNELPPTRGVSVTRPNGLPPSSLEVRTYALKYTAATEPRTVFDDAKRGTLRHEQVDTLQANWPELYDDLKNETLVAMGNGKSTIQQRQRADLLFGFTSALDPAFSTRLSAAAKAARAAQAQNSKGPSGAPTKSRVTETLTPDGLEALQ